jgi:hypothetical protein
VSLISKFRPNAASPCQHQHFINCRLPNDMSGFGVLIECRGPCSTSLHNQFLSSLYLVHFRPFSFSSAYLYHNDEWALPGNLLCRKFISVPPITRSVNNPHTLLFSLPFVLLQMVKTYSENPFTTSPITFSTQCSDLSSDLTLNATDICTLPSDCLLHMPVM